MTDTLPRYSPQNLNRTALHFTLDRGHEQFDVNAPYQRQSVWGINQRRALIKSLQMGLPVGGVWTNDRGPTTPFAVIDGRQRIETLWAWANNEFSVPAAWWDDRDLADADRGSVPYVYANDLTGRGRRRWESWQVGEFQVRGLTVREEADLYLLINFGGTPQTDADRARALAVAQAR